MNALIVPLLAGTLVVALLTLAIVLFRRSGGDAGLGAAGLEKQIERVERELRTAIESSSGQVRMETGRVLNDVQSSVVQQVVALGGVQGQQLESFGQRVDSFGREADEAARRNRAEQVETLERFSASQRAQLESLAEQTNGGLRETRATVDAGLVQLKQETATRLEESRTGSASLLTDLQANLLTVVTEFGREQGVRLETFGQKVEKATEASDSAARANREETAGALKRSSEVIEVQLTNLAQTVNARLAEIGTTLETRIGALQADNTAKLEEMRKTVDEKLQTTLEARLGESFRLVSERLEQVQRGLGEMQTLATGVGDLKRVLTNVKSRGGFGEVQLGALLDQLLTLDQYGKNVATRPGSAERVEFAVRLPGNGDEPCWLPIDAKFPMEDFERLQVAQDAGDLGAIEVAGKALENRIRLEARTIREKYIDPPHTTDFGLLYLPTEGLYAEVLRRPGLVDTLQREQRVVVAGPTTLAALLSSLQMGFRSLAIQKRSAEVWQVLGAVKHEFEKFGGVLDKLKGQLQRATSTIEDAETRTRVMSRKLRSVEVLPEGEAAKLLPVGDVEDEGVETVEPEA